MLIILVLVVLSEIDERTGKVQDEEIRRYGYTADYAPSLGGSAWTWAWGDKASGKGLSGKSISLSFDLQAEVSCTTIDIINRYTLHEFIFILKIYFF